MFLDKHFVAESTSMANKYSEVESEDGWKKKYLNSLEDIERLETDTALRMDIFRRCMVRVSLAADGVDVNLDNRLAQLREALRHELKNAELERLSRQVEDAVLAQDERKAENNKAFFQQFEKLTQQLVELSPSGKIKNKLKTFLGPLKTSLGSGPLDVSVLAEYACLQEEVVFPFSHPDVEPSSPKEGFFGRLFGGRNNGANDELLLVKKQSPDVEVCSTETEFMLDISKSAVDETAVARSRVKNQADTAVDSYEGEAVRERVGGILLTLLELLQIPERYKMQEQSVREKIAMGLRWPEVPDILSEIVSMVSASSTQLQKETEIFLQGLNTRLNDIQAFLAHNQQSNAQKEANSERLDLVVKGHIADITSHINNSIDINTLKVSIEEQLNKIMVEMDGYKQTEKKIDAETYERVNELVARMECLEKEAATIRATYDEHKEQAFTDALTQLPNRLAYERRSMQEYSRWYRYAHPLSMVMCDLDLFKSINDDYGHAVGDKVLKKVSDLFKKNLRETDFVSRYGGEEFIILLPETALAPAELAMNKLRETIAQSPFHYRGEPVQVSVSMGISQFKEGDNLELVFDRADKAVYEAKAAGRNCVVTKSA